MIHYLLVFLFAGFICFIVEFIYKKTNLTSAHLTTLGVILGATLSFFNVYDYLIDTFNFGARSLILNYGHMLYQAGRIGAKKSFFDIFLELMKSTSGVLSFVIITSLIFTFLKKKYD